MYSNFGPAGDFSDVGNTLDDDTTNSEAGTYTAVGVGDVATGVQYGEDGTEFTGTGEVGASSIFFLRRR